MIKKYGKYVLASICVFFISLMTSAAKEVSIDELTEMVKEVNSSASHVYVIGEYAFTSKHTLTTQDIMLAARSIKVNDNTGKTNGDAIYNEMIITYLEGAIGSDWKLESLKFNKNVVGPNNEPTKYDIKYIDYVEYKEKVDVDSLVDDAYNTIKNQASDKFTISIENNDVEIFLKDLEMNSIDAIAGSGVATAALNFLNEDGIKSVTLAYGKESITITKDSLDKDAIQSFLKAIVGDSGKAKDLIGKEIKVDLEFEEGYESANSSEFTITFVSEVDVDALVKKAYETIKNQAATDKFIVTLNKTAIDVKITDLKMTSVDALAGTGVSTAALNFLKENGIATVTLVYGNEDITISSTSLDADEIESFLKTIGNSASDLVGKTITAKIDFIDGYKTANSSEFAITFSSEIDVDALVKKAYETIKKQSATDKFVVDLNNGAILVTLINAEMSSVDALTGTGVSTAASNFLKENGIASVTLAYGSEELNISSTSLDADEVESFFKEIGTSANDLIGKTLNVTISFEEGYETLNSNKFDITFKDAKKVDVDSLVDEAYKTIKNQAATEIFEISKEDNNVNILLKDLEMNSINAIAGSGVATSALNFLSEEGVASVTLSLDGASIKIEETLTDDAKQEIEAFFKAIGSKAGDLVGKTMTATVAFEEGYKSANSKEFTINFGKKIDVDSLVKKAYKTISNQAAIDKFVAKLDGTNIEVTIMDLEMASADALIGTGVSTAATNFIKEQGIENVKLTIADKSVTVGTEINADELEAFLKQFGTKAGDLVGKTMTAEISFKNGFDTANSNKFTITFENAIKVDVDTLVEEAYELIKEQASEDKFLVDIEDNIRVVLVDETMSSVDALMGTGVSTAAINFLKTEGIKSVTLKYSDTELEITKNNIDADEVELFLKKIGSKASDLVGKEITAQIAFEDGYKTANSNEFTIEIARIEKIDVNSLVKKAYDVIEDQAAKDKFIVTLDGTNIEMMLVDLNMSSIDALIGTGVSTAASNFLKEEGIKSVTLVYGSEELTISADSIDATEVETFLKKIGDKASDLIGKELTAKLAFKVGYDSANAKEFTINIVEEKKVDVNSLVKKAYDVVEKQNAKDKIIVKLDGTNMIVTLVDLSMTSVDALMGTGIGTAITNFLNEEGIEKVTLVYGEASANISSNHIDADEIENFLKTIGTSAESLVGKKITAKIDFVEGYKSGNANEFILDIREEEKVDVAALATSAYNLISSKENKVFEAELDGTNIEIILKDLTVSSVDTLAGSGIGEAALNFLAEDGVETVCLTYGGAEACFNENNINYTEVQNFFDKLGTTTNDLLGKNIGVGILFEEGYKTGNVSNFTVSFSKVKYNVNFDVDGNVTTKKVEVGDMVSEPTIPTKEGYTFDKWLLNGSEYDFSTPIAEDITLTASWTINTYKINIVANDYAMGSVSIDELEVDYGTKIEVSNNSITIGNQTVVATPADKTPAYTYSFGSWSNADNVVKGAVTITANFNKTLNQYIVTYKDSEGHPLGTEEVDYGTHIDKLTIPEKNGYSVVMVSGADKIIDNTTLTVEYAEIINVDDEIDNSIEEISSTLFVVKPLTEDKIDINFHEEVGLTTVKTMIEDIVDVMQTLSSNDKYESVILSYGDQELNISELVYEDLEFGDFVPADHEYASVVKLMFGVDATGPTDSATKFARFVSKIAGESGNSGSDILKVTVEKLVAGTKTTPVEVNVNLKSEYVNSDESPEAKYDLVFTLN